MNSEKKKKKISKKSLNMRSDNFFENCMRARARVCVKFDKKLIKNLIKINLNFQ